MTKPAHFTPEHQRWARSKVRRESLIRAGQAGYRALANKYGAQYAARRLANYRREHVSPLVQIVTGWLIEMELTYQLEVEIGNLYLDILVDKLDLVIECDGAGLHTAAAPEAAKRFANDRRKENLIQSKGWRLLRLSEKEIRNCAGRARLVEAVAEEHALGQF